MTGAMQPLAAPCPTWKRVTTGAEPKTPKSDDDGLFPHVMQRRSQVPRKNKKKGIPVVVSHAMEGE